MAQSKREQIITALAEKLKPSCAGAVYRAPSEALSAKKMPCVVIDWLTESDEPLTSAKSEVRLAVRVVLYDKGHDDAENKADALAVEAHAAIMADRRVGNMAEDTRRTGASKDKRSDDVPITAISHLYEITYRINSNDLTT